VARGAIRAHNYRSISSALRTAGALQRAVWRHGGRRARHRRRGVSRRAAKLLDSCGCSAAGTTRSPAEVPPGGRRRHGDGPRVTCVGGLARCGGPTQDMLTTSYCVGALVPRAVRTTKPVTAPICCGGCIGSEHAVLPDRRRPRPPAAGGALASRTTAATLGPRAARAPPGPATGAPAGAKIKERIERAGQSAGRCARRSRWQAPSGGGVAVCKLARGDRLRAVDPGAGPLTTTTRATILRSRMGGDRAYIADAQGEYRAQALEYRHASARAASSAGRTRTRPNQPARHAHYEFFPYVNLAHWRL